MARARSIKPSYFTNDGLAKVEPLGRILFAGLWCLADRKGRLEDRPAKIKVQLLPYDNCDCDALLNALQTHKFIERYEVDGARYIQVTKFEQHQNPHVKEADSLIPAPKKHGASAGNSGTSRALTLNPVLDSLNPIPDGKQSLPGSFARFWLAYPKKKSRGQALKAWQKLKPSEQLVTEILAAIGRAKTSVEWGKDDGKFIPHPATWLNAEGWLDEMTRDEPSGFFEEKTNASQ